jgi:dihydroorotase-like cyclic amidohydrolase
MKMSIFGNIASAIFGHRATTTTATPGSPTGQAAPAAKGTPTAAGTPATGQPLTRQQVEEMIKKIADQQHEDLDWNKSIVDLMKLLKLDSSLNARKQLAQELGYKGALTGSAEMNVWLHQQVMQKLAESGGVVPDSLKHA